MGAVKRLTPFGMEVKCRLIEMEHTQTWLQERINEETGLFVDGSYLYKILTGQRNAPKIVQAIREILNITDAPQG